MNNPTLPSAAPKYVYSTEVIEEVPKKKFIEYFYNREKQEYCGRTLKSWVLIIGYAILYLIFLTTFFLVMLYSSLLFLKRVVSFQGEPSALVYPVQGIGLTATPTSESSYPLIWYKHDEKDDFEKYVQAIDELLNSQETKKAGNLGPCEERPYGYGESPCVIIKINKRFHWSGKPLQLNSTMTKLVPPEVKRWMKADSNRLWLQCDGYHSYDREHIGNIKYYPDPPGLDPAWFPLDKEDKSPIVAIQISDFTVGISLAIECKLWYENGPSTTEFVLYVLPNDSLSFTGQYNGNI